MTSSRVAACRALYRALLVAQAAGESEEAQEGLRGQMDALYRAMSAAEAAEVEAGMAAEGAEG